MSMCEGSCGAKDKYLCEYWLCVCLVLNECIVFNASCPYQHVGVEHRKRREPLPGTLQVIIPGTATGTGTSNDSLTQGESIYL